LRRRSRRYALAGLALAFGLVGGGIAARATMDGASVDTMLAKLPSWRALAQKVSF
jgi:hypothetical protein